MQLGFLAMNEKKINMINRENGAAHLRNSSADAFTPFRLARSSSRNNALFPVALNSSVMAASAFA